MKLKILFTILISPFFALAQNLVPNPSLERGCPLDLTYLSASVPWDNPTLASPDYFNVCSFSPRSSVPTNDFGYQNARTGDGYAGFYADQLTTPFYLWREYLQVQLTSPLQAGETYDVQFYWNLANASSRYVEELGAYFSTTQVNGFYDGNIPVSPQVESSGVPLNDTTNWVAFNGSFVASGGEEYLVIGNFRNAMNSTLGYTPVPCPTTGFMTHCDAYYYIDDVSVKLSGGDIIDTTSLGLSTGLKEEGFSSKSVMVYPNPTKKNLSINLESVYGHIEAVLIGPLGNQVFTGEYYNIDQINFVVDFPSGVYFLKLRNEEGIELIKKIVVY